MKKLFQMLGLLLLWQVLSLNLHAQETEVTGLIKDAGGLPMVGATVKQKGTTNTVLTNDQGAFRIKVTSANAVLVISYVGMVDKEVMVTGSDLGTISLVQGDTDIGNVVVVGYGTQRKKEVTGAISSVKPEDLVRMPVVSVNEMLRGQAAGVQVTQGSARPGGSSNIRIRGTRTLAGADANNPLFVLDGVPVENIDDINVMDVESIEVLKDAAATAIYGARAANGVVLVTTKRAKAGKLQVDVGASYAIQQLKRNFDLYNPEEWAQLRREAFRQGTTNNNDFVGTFPPDQVIFTDVILDAMQKGISTNWEDIMLRDAGLQRYDVSVRAGSEKTKFAASYGKFIQQGLIVNSGFDRNNLRFNIDQKINDKISFGSNFSYMESVRNDEDGSFLSVITLPPFTRAYGDDGELLMVVGESSQFSPIWNDREATDRTQSKATLINVFGDWRIVKGLKYRANFSLNTTNSLRKNYRSTRHTSTMATSGSGLIAQTEYRDLLFENILTYDKDFGKAGKLDLSFVQSVNEISNESNSQSAQGFPNDLLGIDGISSAQNIFAPQRAISERKLLSYMGRARYNYLDKYFVSLTMRADGASVFGDENKWGYFPSAAVAWVMSEEGFLKQSDIVSNLKLRASYGSVGNQAVTPYRTLGVATSYLFLFGNNSFPVAGYLPSSELYNPALKWETSLTTNLGLDFGLFKDRLTGSFEWYDTRTKDLLIRKSIPAILGYTSQFVNLGEVQNKGIELTLRGTPVQSRDFRWTVDFIYSQNRNKILKIDGRVDQNGNPVNDLNNRWFIGRSANVYFDHVADGIWQTKEEIAGSSMPNARPGDTRVVDFNKDGIINADDRQIIDRDPKFIYTFRNSFSYKGFDVMGEIYGVEGGVLQNSFLFDYNSGGSLNGALNGVKVDYWTPENPSTTFVRPYQIGNSPYFASLAYQDASYIRLRSLSIGYTFQKQLLDKINIPSLRVFAIFTNLWTKTDFLSYSPEVNPGGYPEPRVAQFGINLSL
jgi:TonB-linked SusC/RagA family outer membrane protein